MANKRVFLSDVHMNAGWSTHPAPDKHRYDWLGEEDADDLADFLGFLPTYAGLKEVVIIGDLMDSWVCPVDVKPPTFENIVNAQVNKRIMQTLRSLCRSVKVLYFPGNRDMGVTREFVEAQFPGMIFGGASCQNSVFRTSRLRAEHGSAHTIFNAADPINAPGSWLPLGYYLCRVMATRVDRTGRGVRQIGPCVDDLLETLGPRQLPAAVFEALLAEAGLDEDTRIEMEGDASPTAGQIKQRFAGLYDQWEQHYGSGSAFKAVMAELGWLEDTASRLCKGSGTNVVIFGHNHDWKLSKSSSGDREHIYANCGSWCDGKTKSFIETEKIDRLQHVRVMEWKYRKHSLLAEEMIPA